MKIKRVTVHSLASPAAEPFAFSQGWVHCRVATIVETADGVVGRGERNVLRQYRSLNGFPCEFDLANDADSTGTADSPAAVAAPIAGYGR